MQKNNFTAWTVTVIHAIVEPRQNVNVKDVLVASKIQIDDDDILGKIEI